MKKIRLWDMRFPNRAPAQLELDDAIASACVRSGVATPADPSDFAVLQAGGPLDPASPFEIIIQSGVHKALERIYLPASVAAIAIGTGLAASTGAAVTIVPPSPSTYLPALASAPSGAYAAWGFRRMLPGYGGPACRFRRQSDNVEQDFGFGPDGEQADIAAMQAWAGSSIVRLVTLYDQTGNGRHLTQPTAANQMNVDVAFPVNGMPTFVGNNSNTFLFMSATGLTINRANMSMFGVLQPLTLSLTTGYWDLVDGATHQHSHVFQGGIAKSGPWSATDGGSVRTHADLLSGCHRTQPTVVGLTSGASDRKVFSREQNWSVPAIAAATGSELRIGRAQNFYNQCRNFGWVLYDVELSASDAGTLVSSLNAMHGINVNYDSLVVIEGDSIASSVGFATYNRSAMVQMAFARNPEIYNLALGGTTMQANYEGRASRTLRIINTFRVGRPCVTLLEAGTNDVGTTGLTGSAIYSTYAAPLIADIKAAGSKVLIQTLTPRTDALMDPTKQTELANYNTLARANSGAADGVVDVAASAPFAAGGVTTGPLYVDQLHHSAAGCAIVAPLWGVAIYAQLGASS